VSENIIPFAPPSTAKPRKLKKGKFLEDLAVKQWREIRPLKNARAGDRYFCCHIVGDSLSGDGIFDGDYVVCREPFKLSEITHGSLAAVSTPVGLLVKHVFFGLKEVHLANSNPDYEDLYFKPDEVEVRGIVVRIERDIE
jgi:SOS-response transcriptional repressor LexA